MLQSLRKLEPSRLKEKIFRYNVQKNKLYMRHDMFIPTNKKNSCRKIITRRNTNLNTRKDKSSY